MDAYAAFFLGRAASFANTHDIQLWAEVPPAWSNTGITGILKTILPAVLSQFEILIMNRLYMTLFNFMLEPRIM